MCGDRDLRGHSNGGIPNFTKKLSENGGSEYAALVKANIPDSVTIIEPFAFEECTLLLRVVVTSSITIIEEESFEECTSLNIIVGDNLLLNSSNV